MSKFKIGDYVKLRDFFINIEGYNKPRQIIEIDEDKKLVYVDSDYNEFSHNRAAFGNVILCNKEMCFNLIKEYLELKDE